MGKTFMMMTLLGLSLFNIMVLDSLQDLRQLTKDSRDRNLNLSDWDGLKQLLEKETTDSAHKGQTRSQRNLGKKYQGAIDALDNLDGGNIKRQLEAHKKHAMTTVPPHQHKTLGLTRDFLCYKNNGKYKILTLSGSSTLDQWLDTERGCTKLIPL